MSEIYSDTTRKIEALGEALFSMSGRLVEAGYFEGHGNDEAYERVVEAFTRLRDSVVRGGVQ